MAVNLFPGSWHGNAIHLGMGQQSTSGSHGYIWLLHSQLIHLVSPKMARLDTNYDSYSLTMSYIARV